MSPRLWLFVWGGLGALLIGFVILSASVSPRPERTSACKASVVDRNASFLTGEMADFIYPISKRSAPDQRFQVDGRDVSMRDFRGKTVLVNFWASWCAPCLKELPSLNALEGALGSDKFQVVAVAADPKGPKTARQYLDRLNIKNLTLFTDQKLQFASAVGGASVLPVSILYDPRGVELGRLVGEADWESVEAKRLVRNAVECAQ